MQRLSRYDLPLTLDTIEHILQLNKSLVKRKIVVRI